MDVTVTYKNFESSDSLREYAEKKLNKLDKFSDKPMKARVVFSVEKTDRITELSITGSRLDVYAREKSDEMRTSIDMVVDKIRKQLSKAKEKIKSRRQDGVSKDLEE